MTGKKAIALVAMLALLVFIGLYFANVHSPRLYAQGGRLHLGDMPDRLYELSGDWHQQALSQPERGGVAQLTLSADDPSELCIYVTYNMPCQLWINGIEVLPKLENSYLLSDTLSYYDNGTGVFDIALAHSELRSVEFSYLGVYVGRWATAHFLHQLALCQRLLIVGISFAAMFYSISLYRQKRSERYLIPMALMSYFTMVLTLSSALPIVRSHPLVNLLVLGPIQYPLLPPQANYNFHQLVLIFFKVTPRFALIQGFMPAKVGRYPYYAYVVVGYLLSLPLLPTDLYSVYMMVLTLAIYLMEAYVILRHYLRDAQRDISLVVGNTLALTLWVFVTACSLGWIPNGVANVHFKLWGVIDCAYNLAFLSAVNTRFAGKFSKVDELSAALERMNQALEVRVAEKTAQLHASYAQVIALQRSKEAFMTDIIHNIKTPLFTVGGYIDMAKDSLYAAPEAAGRMLDSANSNIDYARRMTDDLLLLSRLDEGSIAFDSARILIDELLGSILGASEVALAAKGLRMVYGGYHGSLQLEGDAHYLRQALQNIVDNAIRHSPQGGCIYLTAEALGQAIALRIRDEGPGIPAADLPHVFDRYYTKVQGKKGVGLGLTIARQLVEKMHGHIAVENMPGQGCQFTVTFPAVGGG